MNAPAPASPARRPDGVIVRTRDVCKEYRKGEVVTRALQEANT